MGYPLVIEAYIIPVIIGGIAGLILCLYFNKYKKEAEKYRDISKKLEKANNEYAKTCDEVDALAGNLEKMIKLTSGMNFTVNNSDEAVFLKELLDTARTLIPEADYGSVSIVNGDKWEYIDAFGHDLNKLKKIDLKKEYMLNYQEIELVDSIVDENIKTMPDDIYEEFKDASRDIKTSLLVSVDVGLVLFMILVKFLYQKIF